MKKALAVLLLAILASACIPTVSADHHISRNNHTLQSNELMLLELDFTIGTEALVALKVTSNNNVNVRFISQEYLVPTIEGADYFYYTYYSTMTTTLYDRAFFIETPTFANNIYYFLIEPSGLQTAIVDVKYDAWIDYDGDGEFGLSDPYPLVSKDWINILTDRLNATELNDSNALSGITSLGTELDQTQTELSSLSDNLDLIQTDLYNFKMATRATERQLGDELNATSSAINSTIDLLQAEIDSLSNRLDGLRNDLDLLDSNLTVLSSKTATKDAELQGKIQTLDDREALNNQAQVQNIQDNHDEALAAATSARNIGLVVGIVGILLALVAILLALRVRKTVIAAPMPPEAARPVEVDLAPPAQKPQSAPTSVPPPSPSVRATSVPPPPPPPDPSSNLSKQVSPSCSVCGARLVPDDRFCSKCGAPRR